MEAWHTAVNGTARVGYDLATEKPPQQPHNVETFLKENKLVLSAQPDHPCV